MFENLSSLEILSHRTGGRAARSGGAKNMMVHKVSRAALALMVGVTVVAASSVAGAQSLRPNILIVFDTSGSMLYNQANDGSPLCSTANGYTQGQSSRIYSLKSALQQALAQVGTDEANIGLMRF